MKILLRLLKKANRYYKYLAIAMFALVGITLSQLYAPWVVREITRMATMGYGGEYIASTALSMGLTLLGIYLFQGVCMFLRGHFIHVAAWNFVSDLRIELYDKLQSFSQRFYHDKQTGDLMSRVINDTNYIELLVAHAVPDMIVNVLIFVSVGTVLFTINPLLAAICLATIPFMVVGSMFYNRVVLPRFKKRNVVIAKLNSTLNDNLSGIKEIQVFNQQRNETKNVSGLSDDHAQKTINALWASSIYHPFVQFSTFMGTVLVIIIGGYFASGGTMPIEDVVAFVLYLGIFYQPINVMARANEDMQMALASAERIFEILDTSVDIREKENALQLGRARGEIAFHGVSFSYDNRSQLAGEDVVSAKEAGAHAQLVTDNLNLTIKPGEVIALVGPTGVGKSTLVNLIARFYDPTDGFITLDGHDLRDLSLASLRDNMTMVLQDIFLFTGTVRENIQYSNPSASEAEIIHAAKVAHAHEFIEELEYGYDTVIGERGIRLSGGQKQRLSIARAVLRNTPILILDEATASVDIKTEKLIHQAMDRVMENRTTVIIAHRLSTIKKADRIIVLKKGGIEEIGTHEELLAKGGTYAQMIAADEA